MEQSFSLTNLIGEHGVCGSFFFVLGHPLKLTIKRKILLVKFADYVIVTVRNRVVKKTFEESSTNTMFLFIMERGIIFIRNYYLLLRGKTRVKEKTYI